tara:strand:- start:6232 stop:7773 length:1542 start_codon:yes stop_codon:yes gene_type:complete
MNVNKVIKISSNQGGNFTATSNLVDFDIPADGIYDLSKSYVNLTCSVSQPGADGSNNGGNATYMPFIRMADEAGNHVNAVLPNVSVIRNCDLSCANRGVISDIRRVDVLRSNLQQYSDSSDELKSKNYKLFTPSYPDSQQINSIFREIVKEGNKLSLNKSAGIRVPLSHLFGFGNIENYDTVKYGKTRLHLELQPEKVLVSQYLGNTDAGNQWSRTDTKNQFQDATATISSDLTTFNWFAGSDVAQPLDLRESPFWVNQKIRVSATAGVGRAGGDLVNVVRRIVSINWRRGVVGVNQANLEITLNSPISTGGNLTGTETYTGITFDGDATTSDVFSIDNAELVLEKNMNPPIDMPDELSYTEFSTEEHNCNGVQNFQRMFECEPECMNLYILKADSILSFEGDLQSWRLRSDNIDLTNRKVESHSPLALDRVQMTMENSGKKVDNLNERAHETHIVRADSSEYYKLADKSLVMVCNPLPITPRAKQVQVNMTNSKAASDLNRICLFKENFKSI